MLDGPTPGVSTCGALSLHKKRFLNSVYEVYRSNLESKGSWGDDEDEGHLRWGTLVYLHEANQDGQQEKNIRPLGLILCEGFCWNKKDTFVSRAGGEDQWFQMASGFKKITGLRVGHLAGLPVKAQDPPDPSHRPLRLHRDPHSEG